MATFRTTISSVFPMGENPVPKKTWGKTFVRTSGFVLKLTARHSMAVFVDRRFGAAHGEERASFLQNPCIFAHCLSTLGLEWRIESEPLEAHKIGLVIYTQLYATRKGDRRGHWHSSS